MKITKLFFLITVLVITVPTMGNEFDTIPEPEPYQPQPPRDILDEILYQSTDTNPKDYINIPDLKADYPEQKKLEKVESFNIDEMRQNYPALKKMIEGNPNLAYVFRDHIDNLKGLEEKKEHSIIPTILLSLLLVTIAIVAHKIAPKMLASFKKEYSTIKINEGRKRLRILLSVLSAIFFYVYLYTTEYKLDATELFFQFPIFSLGIFALIFIILTASYWVIDGFNSHEKK